MEDLVVQHELALEFEAESILSAINPFEFAGPGAKFVETGS